jgi:hypothetical protein
MGFYPQTIAAVRAAIRDRHGSLEPNEYGIRDDLPGYLLWMVGQVESWPATAPSELSALEASVKAASWMGWVNRSMEVLEFWDNDRSRDLIRADKKARSHLATIAKPPG